MKGADIRTIALVLERHPVGNTDRPLWQAVCEMIGFAAGITHSSSTITPEGAFFRSYELLFRWDGKVMHVWRLQQGSRFQALSTVRGRIYTA